MDVGAWYSASTVAGEPRDPEQSGDVPRAVLAVQRNAASIPHPGQANISQFAEFVVSVSR